jgi:hypothetical protein
MSAKRGSFTGIRNSLFLRKPTDEFFEVFRVVIVHFRSQFGSFLLVSESKFVYDLTKILEEPGIDVITQHFPYSFVLSSQREAG